MKRFIMAFDMLWTVRRSEQNFVQDDALARWLVAGTRWPELTDWLRAHAGNTAGIPKDLGDLLRSEPVRQVLTLTDGTPFDSELVRRCSGIAGPKMSDSP